jgi:uncharacterized repeat protein (TIGR03803 family)
MGLVVAATAALAAVGVSAATAEAPKFNLLYTFTGNGTPLAGLVADKAGNLYGTAYAGGNGSGSVFKLAPGGTLTTLYSFQNNGTDGTAPIAPVILDKAGNLYGTTFDGGSLANIGTVYKLAPDGTETVLHSFAGGSDGENPLSGLLALHGNLYGMTDAGGTYGVGVVFKVAADGTETVLHAFQGGPDGATPIYNALIADKNGNLYGTTYAGGTPGFGTVFKLAGHHETVLYAFKGGNDGASPTSGVILDKAGNLYGTTSGGGAGGFGTVFEVAANGTESVLYSFKGGSDGSDPASRLFADSGNFYGMTNGGGAGGFGTVYKLAPDGTEKVLRTLNGVSDGSAPIGGLVKDGAYQKGALFGTASGGGTDSSGTIFSITK